MGEDRKLRADEVGGLCRIHRGSGRNGPGEAKGTILGRSRRTARELDDRYVHRSYTLHTHP
jgi:hypothetical protein